MFRWPIQLTPLSLGSGGLPKRAMLEVTPRGASFTLAALSYVGHPAHLALIDAYLKGQVRLTPSASIGEDSRTVAASLAAPLVVAHEMGVERLSLADVILLPPDPRAAKRADLAVDGRPVSGPDAPRLLLRAHGVWHWVRGAERFEAAGCLGTRVVGQGEQWHHVVAELPSRGDLAAGRGSSVGGGGRVGGTGGLAEWPVPIRAEAREPSTFGVEPMSDDILGRQRADAFGRFARRPSVTIQIACGSLDELLPVLVTHARQRRSLLAAVAWRGQDVDVCLAQEPDDYQTLCLLPPPRVLRADGFDTMRDLAWETIEGLIGRQLPEWRTEPIALRLLAEDGRSTMLDIGASVVIGRNQVVFAAWVGSDGRVMLRLFPLNGGNSQAS